MASRWSLSWYHKHPGFEFNRSSWWHPCDILVNECSESCCGRKAALFFGIWHAGGSGERAPSTPGGEEGKFHHNMRQLTGAAVSQFEPTKSSGTYLLDSRSKFWLANVFEWQVGCAQGCRFCKTATMGIVRNLHPDEILAQAFVMISDSFSYFGHSRVK